MVRSGVLRGLGGQDWSTDGPRKSRNVSDGQD